LWSFTTIGLETQNLVKIGQIFRALLVKSHVQSCAA